MFATILRRWRLVTPLVLAVLAISIVSGGMMMPASAHDVKFHFFGRAFALEDLYGLPDVACDTGFLAVSGSQSLDSGHCFGAAGFGVPGNAVTGTGRLATIFAEDTVVSTHGHVSGKVTATADTEGQGSASEVVDLFRNSSGILDRTCCPGSANGGVNINQDCRLNGTIPDRQEVEDGDAETAADEADSLACSPQVDALVFVSTHITEVAVAACHRRSNGSTQATVAAATTNMVNPAVTENNVERFIGPNGLPNQSFVISGFVDSDGHSFLSILVVLNEQKPFVDGDLGAISANAVHIVGTNNQGFVVFDFIIDHVFAGIHCAKHLGTEQNVGTLVGD
jgi:hypothetical protein